MKNSTALKQRLRGLQTGAVVLSLLCVALLPWNYHPPAQLSSQSFSKPSQDFNSKVQQFPESDAQSPFKGLIGNIADTYARPKSEVTQIVLAANQAAKSNDIPLSLILAVISVESSFDPKAKNDSGARGLMQVMPRYHREKLVGIDDLSDIESNIRVGAQILKEYRQNNSDWRAVLTRYSGGARAYYEKVMHHREQFQMAMAASSDAATP